MVPLACAAQATASPLSSRYRGNRLPVLRAIDTSERRHPNPKGSLPSPESSVSASDGPQAVRLGEKDWGTLSEAAPVRALAENFSPVDRIAPPPLGRVMNAIASIAAVISTATDHAKAQWPQTITVAVLV